MKQLNLLDEQPSPIKENSNKDVVDVVVEDLLTVGVTSVATSAEEYLYFEAIGLALAINSQINGIMDLDTLKNSLTEDLKYRKEIGIKRYGIALKPFNGRDALIDAYEEAIDMALYLKQNQMEKIVESNS